MKKVLVYGSVAVIIIIVGTSFLFGGSEKLPDFVVAKRADLVQEVSATGRVKPAESVDLAFEKSGKVSVVLIQVGDAVKTGQQLLVLDYADLAAQLRQAEANVKAELARLDELRRGTRPEDLELQRVKVQNAETALLDAKQNLLDKLTDAYTKGDDAVRNRVDQMFTNPRTSNPQIQISISTAGLETQVENERLSLEVNAFPSWQNIVGGLSLNSDLLSAAQSSKAYLDWVKAFLDKIALIVNDPNNSRIITTGTTTAIPDTWKADVSSARTNVNTAVNTITVAETSLKSAQASLDVTRQELALKVAGTAPEQIASQEAKVESARASADSLRAQIAKSILRAPIDGIVTRQEAKIGEIVSANTVVVSLISQANFEIDANIPEADIAKVQVGNTARVTLDAYTDDIVFDVAVSAIDPAETLVDGVATYKVTFQFTRNDERVRSGMTANIDISTETRRNVIIVPQRTVITRDSKKMVKILEADDTTQREVEVQTGLRGSDGNIEITAGISEGDRVIIFIAE